MPEETKTEKLNFAKLSPGAITVKVNGEEVRLATSVDDNQILNAVLVAQGRSLIHNQLKLYKDAESIMSPKDLKDIMSAIRDNIETSERVFNGQSLPIKNETQSQQDKMESQVLDLTKLAEKAEDKGTDK